MFSSFGLRFTGVSIDADGLSLDLAFALDKTLVARKGPTPTFTRGSTATFIGSNGLIQSAAANAPRFDHDPITGVCRGLLIEEQRTNAVLNSDAPVTQGVTVTAAAHTLSFYGTGTVVLSGTHSATVVGTGAYPARTTLTFTPSAGTLTLTVTGTVEFAQLEVGQFPTSYIPTTTAALTRSEDVCSITGSDFTDLWNTSGGTVLVDYQYLFAPVSQQNRRVLSGGFSRRVVHGYSITTDTASPWFFDGTTNLAYSITAETGHFIGVALEPTQVHGVAQGVIGTNRTHNGTLLTGMTYLRLFEGTSGIISALRYHSKVLSDSKLITLTT